MQPDTADGTGSLEPPPALVWLPESLRPSRSAPTVRGWAHSTALAPTGTCRSPQYTPLPAGPLSTHTRTGPCATGRRSGSLALRTQSLARASRCTRSENAQRPRAVLHPKSAARYGRFWACHISATLRSVHSITHTHRSLPASHVTATSQPRPRTPVTSHPWHAVACAHHVPPDWASRGPSASPSAATH